LFRLGRSATIAVVPLAADEETIQVPRALRFPAELRPPPGFAPDRIETWPRVEGRLEYVEGRLWYLPPCADEQQYIVSDVVVTLGGWARAHPEFLVGTNEAGVRLGDDTRGADAAVWRRADAGPVRGAFQRVAPVLAVEVAGQDGDAEPALRDKAAWYLAHGVAVVWLVLPRSREVVVVTASGETSHFRDDRLPAHPALPELAPPVAELFLQIDRG